MRIALVPCGGTEWCCEGRLLGRVELPPAADSAAQIEAWTAVLRAVGVQRMLHGPDELTRCTAELIAGRLGIPTRGLEDLVEVDFGLWAGLTEQQLKQRFVTAHRELREAPLNVSPPGGENLRAAAERLRTCIDRQIRKNGVSALGVVVRPFALALAQHALVGSAVSTVWETARHARRPVIIECARPG
jgi:ribonuclease H / adenosylcobalamin/alpha-ribazole phosphatase